MTLKFSVLWLSFVSGYREGDIPRIGLRVPFLYHLALLCCTEKNIFTNSYDHISTDGKALLHSHINLKHPTIPLLALTKGYRSKRQLSKPFTVAIQPFIVW